MKSFRRIAVFVSLILALSVASGGGVRAEGLPPGLLERILVATPEGAEISARLLGKEASAIGESDYARVSALLSREENGALRQEIESKAARINETVERRGGSWDTPESANVFRRAVSAELMLVEDAAAGEIDFVSGGRYTVAPQGFLASRDAFLNFARDRAGQVAERVIPGAIRENAARAQAIVSQLRATADYSVQATRIIGGELLPVTQWVGPVTEVYTDVQNLVETARAGRYAEVPEAAGKLLRRAEDLYSGMLRTFEKLPAGKRRDAYAVVLGDLETLIRVARTTYDSAAAAIRVTGPVAADGVRVVTQAARAVDSAVTSFRGAVRSVEDMTFGNARRLAAAGDEAVEGRIASKYDEQWNAYLHGNAPDTAALLARIRRLVSSRFGIPRLASGALGIPDRVSRLADLLDWARANDASLREGMNLLAERSHPVMNHFVDAYLRTSDHAAADLLRTGGNWEGLPAGERAQVVDAIRKQIDTEADSIIAADAGSLRPFVPEIDALKEFCGRWQDLTDAERRIATAVLLDLPADRGAMALR